jgi:hypothetical protein
MKIGLQTRAQGSVLLVTLLTSVILGIGLASYLSLVSNQNYSTMRSLAWNTATPLAEAGIEEALTHLNDDSDLRANHWTGLLINGRTVYKKRRDFGEDGSFYSVTISNAETSPVIFSLGSTRGPLGRGNSTRAVRIVTMPNGLFNPAIFVKEQIKIGSDFSLDSFDSTNPNYSTASIYDPAKVKANGNLATISTAANSVMIQNSKIFGHIYTPPTGAYILGGGGMVGDQAFQSDPANAGKVQPGYYSGDLNTRIPDAPALAGWELFPFPVGGLLDGIAYDYVLQSGGYQLPSGTALKGKILVVGDATLYVPRDGRIELGSGDVITISSALSASLKLCNASTNDVLLGSISNESGIASRFGYFGLSTTAGTKVTLTAEGTNAFVGAIYAPNQDVIINGPGSGNQNLIGAITANSVTIGGNISMHFDEALARSGGSPRFVIDSYAEIASAGY